MSSLPDRFQPEAVLASSAPGPRDLPQRLLYATSSGIGGTGLDSTSLEGVRASHRADFLTQAICYGIGQTDIPRSSIRSLQWHPVRVLSFLDSEEYYGAKKRYADWIAALTEIARNHLGNWLQPTPADPATSERAKALGAKH